MNRRESDFLEGEGIDVSEDLFELDQADFEKYTELVEVVCAVEHQWQVLGDLDCNRQMMVMVMMMMISLTRRMMMVMVGYEVGLFGGG